MNKLSVLGLVVVVGMALVGALLFFRYNDDTLLTNFITSYQAFNTAMTNSSMPRATTALAELSASAAALSHISSATKHDPEIKSISQEIAHLAAQELANSTSPNQRTAAYTRFQALER